MSTAFISGHIDLTQEEFDKYYATPIRHGLEHHDTFVIGDANGADAMAQQYISGLFELYNKIAKKTNLDCPVTVYHMFESPRNNCGFKTKGGFKSDKGRDKQMTIDSDYDIAWVRKGREMSGTAKNIDRRFRNKKRMQKVEKYGQ
jgi:hypothetical protein